MIWKKKVKLIWKEPKVFWNTATIVCTYFLEVACSCTECIYMLLIQFFSYRNYSKAISGLSVLACEQIQLLSHIHVHIHIDTHTHTCMQADSRVHTYSCQSMNLAYEWLHESWLLNRYFTHWNTIPSLVDIQF